MRPVVRLAVVDPCEATRAALNDALRELDNVWLAAECRHYGRFFDEAANELPDVAIVGLDASAESALWLVRRISDAIPSCRVLTAGERIDTNLILAAQRAGAFAHLRIPLDRNDLAEAIELAWPRATGIAGNRVCERGRLIVVLGTKGGAGCTSLTVNLAAHLARQSSRRVAAVDFDFAHGDLDFCFDVPSGMDQAGDSVTVPERPVDRLARHDCGVYVLSRPAGFDLSRQPSPDALDALFVDLCSTMTHVFIDLGPACSPIDRSVLDQADEILLVTQLDLSSQRNVRWMSEAFQKREGWFEKTRLIANRASPHDAARTQSSGMIDCEFDSLLPDESAVMATARDRGIPAVVVAPRSAYARAIAQLAAELDSANLPVKA